MGMRSALIPAHISSICIVWPSHLEREVHGWGDETALVGVAVVPRDGPIEGAWANGEGDALGCMREGDKGMRTGGDKGMW